MALKRISADTHEDKFLLDISLSSGEMAVPFIATKSVHGCLKVLRNQTEVEFSLVESHTIFLLHGLGEPWEWFLNNLFFSFNISFIYHLLTAFINVLKLMFIKLRDVLMIMMNTSTGSAIIDIFT